MLLALSTVVCQGGQSESGLDVPPVRSQDYIRGLSQLRRAEAEGVGDDRHILLSKLL